MSNLIALVLFGCIRSKGIYKWIGNVQNTFFCLLVILFSLLVLSLKCSIYLVPLLLWFCWLWPLRLSNFGKLAMIYLLISQRNILTCVCGLPQLLIWYKFFKMQKILIEYFWVFSALTIQKKINILIESEIFYFHHIVKF